MSNVIPSLVITDDIVQVVIVVGILIGTVDTFVRCVKSIKNQLRPPEEREKFDGRIALMIEQIYHRVVREPVAAATATTTTFADVLVVPSSSSPPPTTTAVAAISPSDTDKILRATAALADAIAATEGNHSSASATATAKDNDHFRRQNNYYAHPHPHREHSRASSRAHSRQSSPTRREPSPGRALRYVPSFPSQQSKDDDDCDDDDDNDSDDNNEDDNDDHKSVSRHRADRRHHLSVPSPRARRTTKQIMQSISNTPAPTATATVTPTLRLDSSQQNQRHRSRSLPPRTNGSENDGDDNDTDCEDSFVRQHYIFRQPPLAPQMPVNDTSAAAPTDTMVIPALTPSTLPAGIV